MIFIYFLPLLFALASTSPANSFPETPNVVARDSPASSTSFTSSSTSQAGPSASRLALANHGGPSNCRKHSDPKYCSITVDFLPDGKYNNVFNVYDHNCDLDASSHKSINPDAGNLDRSVYGTPMKYSFDVIGFMEVKDPSGKASLGLGFLFNYGNKDKGTAVTFDPNYIENPSPDKSGVNYQNWDCSDPKVPGNAGKCYSVQFVCQD